MSYAITSTYSGEVLEAFITKAFTGNDTVDKGLLMVRSGIQKEYTIPRMTLSEIVQDRIATPETPVNSQGIFTLDEKKLEPQDFMVYTEFNPRDLEQFWRFAQPKGNLVFRELDPTVQVTMVSEIFKRLNLYLGTAIWHGKKTTSGTMTTGGAAGGIEPGSGNLNKFDGLLFKMLYSVINGSTGDQVILSGNSRLNTGAAIITALNDLFNAIPKSIRGAKDLKIVMDWATWDLYDQHLIEQQFKNADYTGTNRDSFRGIRIVKVNGFPVETLLSGRFSPSMQSNLWMGVDVVNDDEVLQVDKLQNNSELYFFKMLMKADTEIPQPSELVLHTPFTLA
ncbi:MAG: hypothetical protein AAF620_00300 [Bacteroidota bacterium]